MLEVCPLASGSSGNCYFVGSKESSILVDVGISAREVANRLEAIGKSINQIEGIFITHEHSDHIKGAEVISKKIRYSSALNGRYL